MRGRPIARPWRASSRRSAALHASARAARDTASRPSICGSTCVTGSSPSGDFGRIVAISCVKPKPSPKPWTTQHRLGWVSAFLSTPFLAIMGDQDQAIAAGQRALALATSWWRCCPAGRWRTSLLRSGLPCPGRLSSGDRLLPADRGVPRRAQRRHERFGEPCSSRCVLPCLPCWSLAELGAFVEGWALGDEGLSRLPKRSITLQLSHDVCLWGIGYLVPASRETCQPGRSACSNGPWHLSRRRHSAPTPLDGCGLWGSVYTLVGRIAEAVPLLEQAVEQTTACGTQ